MILPKSDWQTREGMKPLLAALGAAEGLTRFVGGSVRDTLLGLEVSDVDLATRLAPEEVIRRLESAKIKPVPTGIAHGTVTAVLRSGTVEITTLRRDVATDGRRATVAFTDDWAADAARRDFTINALSADPVSLEIFDYFQGLRDLDRHKVRFIGDPLTRIAEDHLRILRFFRFHARFGGGEPDRAALAACEERANDLMALSRERIADELLKLLVLPQPAPTVELMVRHGILKPVLPEIDVAGAERLEHLVERETAVGIAPDPIRRLASLFPAEPELAAAIAARLRLSNKAQKRLVAAAGREIAEHYEPELMVYQLGLDHAVDRLLLSWGDQFATNEHIRHLLGWKTPKFPLKGRDLIAIGLPPGPLVAKTLAAIEREWANGGFTADVEWVRKRAQLHVDQALRDSQ